MFTIEFIILTYFLKQSVETHTAVRPKDYDLTYLI